MVGLVSQTWRALEDRVRAEFAKSDHQAGDLSFTHMVRMQYYGQLVDIEVDSPSPELATAEDAQALCDAFETTYQRMYARAASSPELGYLVAQAIVKGSVPVEQPRLPELDSESGKPPAKESRQVWWDKGWVDTPIYEMDDVGNGQTIEGPAVLEAESTTFPIPPDRRAWLDEHGIFHLEKRRPDPEWPRSTAPVNSSLSSRRRSAGRG